MAQLLMYHHRLPSPASFFESQAAPGKPVVPLRIENRMVLLQCTQYGNNWDDIKYLRLHAAFVNNSWVTPVQPSWQIRSRYNVSKLSYLTTVSKVNMISRLSTMPGRRESVYSPTTETNAHECFFQPMSVFESIWNRRRTLQYRTLSIWSSKAPCQIPAGRIKT